jgi:hypothetical protein
VSSRQLPSSGVSVSGDHHSGRIEFPDSILKADKVDAWVVRQETAQKPFLVGIVAVNGSVN